MRSVTFTLACVLAATLQSAGAAAPLTLTSARVSLDGTSNVHAFTATTTDVRVTAVEISGTPGEDALDDVLQPGRLTGFEVTIRAAGLASPKEGIDKNMHKALKVAEFPEIRFRLRTLEPAAGAYKGVGLLTIAGVEKEVTLNLQVARKGATLVVTGGTELLMTDFGITPPKMMMGMLKTNPGLQIRLELVLS